MKSMNSSLFCLTAMLFFLVACAAEKPLRLPDLAITQNPQGKEVCAKFFPSGKWQFVHSIVFAMADGVSSTVIGVTTLTGTTIECALVTVEGLTLFEASYYDDNSFEVERAVPPFDRSGFAEGLIRDVRTIFQPSTGSDVHVGYLADETLACRYTASDGKVIDITGDAGECLQIKSYTSDRILDRLIVGGSCRHNESVPIPEYIELKTFGQTGYTLKMTLISADKIK